MEYSKYGRRFSENMPGVTKLPDAAGRFIGC
jgi:hypothetical protein